MDLTTVIVNWNTRDYLRDCLKSIFAKKYPFSHQVVVIDNASSDDSARMVQREFSQVRLMAQKENLGFAKANNLVIRRTDSRYILLLNPDTLVLKDAIEQLINFADEHREVAVVGPQLLNEDGSHQISTGNVPLTIVTPLVSAISPLIDVYKWQKRLSPLWYRWQHLSQPQEVNYIGGACMLIRRSVLPKVGLLDENFFMFNEELDWCERFHQAGCKIYYLPQARVIHFSGRSIAQSKKQMNKEFLKSTAYFFRKHFLARRS